MGISVAMVGVGAFAQSFIPLFKAHPLVERIALCDLDADKLTANARKHDIALTLPSLDALCAADYDAAVIITQQWLHAEQAVQALNAGLHVWSAVPLGLSLQDCEAVLGAVQSSGRVYMMAETSYYYPGVVYCREQHRRGTFGELVYAECQYYHDWDHGGYEVAKWRGGDRWRETAALPPMFYPTHSTSQIISVSDARMTHVSCQGFVDRKDPDIYDPQVNVYANRFSNESALFRMSDGSTCRVSELRRVGHPGTVSMSLYGTEASFEDVGSRQQLVDKRRAEGGEDLTALLTCRRDGRATATGSGASMEAVTASDGTHLGVAPVHDVERLPAAFAGLPNGHSGSHQFLVDDFVRACHENTTPPNNVWEALRYLVPGLIAHQSAEQGGELLAIPDYGAPPTVAG